MQLNPKHMAIFGLMGAMMYISRQVTAALPNIHLTGVFIVVLTVVYRKQALYPLYTFVLLEGLMGGFHTWWLPYLYIWTVLWGAVMLLPRQMPPKKAALLYALVCTLHGLLFGVLYAPAQALMFGLNVEGTLAWIVSGLPYDLIHGCSNCLCSLLILPLVNVVKRMEKSIA